MLQRRLIVSIGAALLLLRPPTASAHDAGAWGGLFRSLDGGATWFQANTGRVVTGALSVAVDAADPDHVLLGTDAGLLETRNGGRDWLTPQGAPSGAVTALWMLADGRVLAATALGLHRWSGRADDSWQSVQVPAGSLPARSLLAGQTPGAVFLVGWRGVFRSEDGGANWRTIESPADQTLTAVLPTREALLGVASDSLWRTTNDGATWTRVADGIQALAPDATNATVWAAGQHGLARSDDDGQTWQSIGLPLPEAETDVRGLTVDGTKGRAVLSTHRGIYVTFDGAASWTAITDNVPGHLQAGPLLVDPRDPTTVYVGFSLTPYEEQFRRVAEGGALNARLSATEIVGSAALLAVVAMLAVASLRWLAVRRVPEPAL